MEEKNNNIRCCDCIYSMGYDEWGRGTFCKAFGRYSGVYNECIECKYFKNKKEQCYMSKIYRLYFLEEGRARFYGQGSYEYMMELLHDYIRIHDIYGEDKIDFRIEKVE